MSRTTLTVASGLPRVPRGFRVETNGKTFVVVKATRSTLTLTPLRWWHEIPWWLLFMSFVVGPLLGFLLSRVLIAYLR